jgi:hypothetical protein
MFADNFDGEKQAQKDEEEARKKAEEKAEEEAMNLVCFRISNNNRESSIYVTSISVISALRYY